MKKLIDQCDDHNYLFLKRQSVPLYEPVLRIVEKEIYACAECGTALEVYDLDNAVEVKRDDTKPESEV